VISVLILTHNEAHDLPSTLDSVAWCDDVHVFDSFSMDDTAAIASARGAHVTQRVFDDYSTQRNAALDTLPFKHDWIFILDADEQVSPDLAAELQQTVRNASGDVAAFRVRRNDFFLGRQLKHAQMTPWYVRLVRQGRARYWRKVNEVLKVDGRVETLHNPLSHYPFSKGLDHWKAKHTRYATMEAETIAAASVDTRPSLTKALAAKDFHERRLHQKALFYRMPARPLIKFLYLYMLRGGFLDGHAGYQYARLQAWYESLIVQKTRELRRKGSASAPPNTPSF
jgi:glycosyltransferase involved in cell wall biosynthesis